MEKQQNFELTEKQDQALDLAISKAKHLMLYGGSRSGKTFFLVYAVFQRAANCPGSKHLILRQAFKHAKTSLWLDTILKVRKIAFPDLPMKVNNSDFYYILPNDSQVWIGGLDDKERTEKILGTEYSTIYFNECSQLDYMSVLMAQTRLAEQNSLLKKIYYDQNPPKKSHWSYWVFEKKIDPIDEVPLSDPENYVSLLMNPKDNIQNIDEEYLALLEKMPEDYKKRFLLGEYTDESDGQVYYSFDRDRHVLPTQAYGGTLFVGMDFNVSPMTAVVGQLIDGIFHIQDEVFLENSDTFKMCNELKKRKYQGRVIPDSTGKNRKTSGMSDHDILRKAGFVVENTLNPFVTDRVNNVNRLFSEDRIIINPKCKKLINDLERVVWKDSKLDQKTNPMLTHISDALGYMCHKLDPLVEKKKSKARRY